MAFTHLWTKPGCKFCPHSSSEASSDATARLRTLHTLSDLTHSKRFLLQRTKVHSDLLSDMKHFHTPVILVNPPGSTISYAATVRHGIFCIPLSTRNQTFSSLWVCSFLQSSCGIMEFSKQQQVVEKFYALFRKILCKDIILSTFNFQLLFSLFFVNLTIIYLYIYMCINTYI